ncbi:MAG TPA: 50S ribosomal protein L22 [bacterium]
MISRAVSSYIRVSPRKLRLIVDLVRNKPVGKALDILRFSKKSASKDVEKIIMSAVNSASKKSGTNIDALFVKTITVDPGPMMKRHRAASMGRAVMIRRRTSHLKIILDVK